MNKSNKFRVSANIEEKETIGEREVELVREELMPVMENRVTARMAKPTRSM